MIEKQKAAGVYGSFHLVRRQPEPIVSPKEEHRCAIMQASAREIVQKFSVAKQMISLY